ncbi:MAG: FAD-dependent oxidoreductase [Pseudomonadota bacterium]
MRQNKSLVLVGAGHTHALALLRLRSTDTADVDITVIDPKDRAVYSGMLPGFIAGHYTRDELDIDVEKLTGPLGGRFIRQAAKAIDPDEKLVVLADGSEVAYDVASLDVGITSNMPSLPGFMEHGLPAKPLAAFAGLWDEYLHREASPKIAIIGGGIAGCELAMAAAFALRQRGKTGAITVVDRGTILGNIPRSAKHKVRRGMTQYGITIVENAAISRVTGLALELEQAEPIEANLVVGAAGATPHTWLHDTGLALDGGYVVVDPYLRSSDPSVFAVGDCAHLKATPIAKAGVYAVRQAPTLADNLMASLSGVALTTYEPQSDYLKLIALGDKVAVAEKWGFSVTTKWAWWLKDHIDMKFMRGFA